MALNDFNTIGRQPAANASARQTAFADGPRNRFQCSTRSLFYLTHFGGGAIPRGCVHAAFDGFRVFRVRYRQGFGLSAEGINQRVPYQLIEFKNSERLFKMERTRACRDYIVGKYPGDPERTSCLDPEFRKLVLYPAELRDRWRRYNRIGLAAANPGILHVLFTAKSPRISAE